MIAKSKRAYVFIAFLSAATLCACGREDTDKGSEQSIVQMQSSKEQYSQQQIEKGYDLPIDEPEKEEATTECKEVMDKVVDYYKQCMQSHPESTYLLEEEASKLADLIASQGEAVTLTSPYVNMANEEKVDNFLKKAEEGGQGSVVLYKVSQDGTIGREKYSFDGTDMYVFAANMSWNTDYEPTIGYMSYTRIKEWDYTDTDWFTFELCVPEPPEVTEVVNGSVMIRVQPMKEQYREISQTYLYGIGYHGNNLFRAEWDTEHMENLDYNGLFQYFYQMKYQKPIDRENWLQGIERELFEDVMTTYLPITTEELEQYASYHEDTQTYDWVPLSAAPAEAEIAIPEVTEVRENNNGTTTLIIYAVSEILAGDDNIMTHELTVKFTDDGGIRYLSNHLLEAEDSYMPHYQYRIGK